MSDMMSLVLACAVFVGMHVLISGTALRGAFVRVIGEGAYMGLFSLGSLAVLVWVGMAYGAAFAGDNWVYWTAPPGVTHLGTIVMALALLLAVPGLMTPGPTTAGMADQLSKGVEAKGIHRITRHPFLWGAFLWAAFHFAANGDRASLVLFGSFLVLTFIGTFSIDAKRKRAFGAAWDAYAATTSNIPFLAIISGRNKLALGEIGLVRLLAALAVFAGLLFAHPWLFGASPIPGWRPY